MSRTPQPEGARGSLRWIQRAVNEGWPSLEQPIMAGTGASGIHWRSPLAADEFAEYRDGEFLDVLGLAGLKDALRYFWPARGPQWDALGLTDGDQVLLVEAKAHVGEMCSPASAAGPASRSIIEARLSACATWMGARSGHAPWTDFFYQLANRLAHLQFLRTQGVDAYLVLVNFVGDSEMKGPTSAEAWESAYDVALHVMGLRRDHSLSRYVIEIYPEVPR